MKELKDKNLIQELKDIIQNARNASVKSINSIQVASNFLIGFKIAKLEQTETHRADYGKEILKNVSEHLLQEFGKGYSVSNLEYMRKFYLIFSDRIPQTLSGKLEEHGKSISQTASGKSNEIKKGINSDILALKEIQDIFINKQVLSWSHYICLIALKDDKERSFYELEANKANWSVRELKRQISSSLYERLALSKDQNSIKELAKKGQIILTPKDVVKDPYVLEFLGLEEKTTYSELDLETAIINKLEYFLLELGKGFLFEARQKRFTFDEDHYFVDLVFYNRFLKCFTLIDLKIGELKHQDLGQMQMYVNYYDRYVKKEDENPTIGIIICKKKNDALVEITLPENSNIHASEYKLYLPSKKELKEQLREAEKNWNIEHEN